VSTAVAHTRVCGARRWLAGVVFGTLLTVACSGPDGGRSGARSGSAAPGAAPPLASGHAVDRAAAREVDRRGGAVAYAGARAIAVGDLLELWLQRDSQSLWAQLNLLLASELARLEAERLGFDLTPAEVERRFARNLAGIEAQWRRVYPELSFERVLRDVLEVDPGRYRQRLRDETVRELVTERVVRAHTLGLRRARVRLIAVETRAEAVALRARIEAGEDFAALAREHSLDPSRESGGRLPWLPDAAASPLAQAAFGVGPGEVAGPLNLGGRELLLGVEEHLEPDPAQGDELLERVRLSLAGEPVSEGEFVAWQVAVQERHPVDLGPLYRLLAEPVPSRRR
jgi:hypothetical protein